MFYLIKLDKIKRYKYISDSAFPLSMWIHARRSIIPYSLSMYFIDNFRALIRKRIEDIKELDNMPKSNILEQIGKIAGNLEQLCRENGIALRLYIHSDKENSTVFTYNIEC